MFRELFEMAGLSLVTKEKQGDFPKAFFIFFIFK